MHNLQSHLAYQYIKKCVLIGHIFCKSLVKIYVKNANAGYFCDIWRCCWPVQKNGLDNQKSILYRFNYDNIELPTDRHFLDLSKTCSYMIHFGLFFRNREIVKKVSTHSFTIKVNQKYYTYVLLLLKYCTLSRKI